jgi:Acetyltransferase (GNAT) domain
MLEAARDGTGLLASIIHPLKDPRWPDFVGHHPAATAFHQPGWISAVSESFGYEPRFHVLERDNEIVAAWPAMLVKSKLTGNRLVCLPFCHRAGPLIDSVQQADQLLTALSVDATLTHAGSIEARDWPSGIATPDRLHKVILYSTHVLDLSGGPDAVRRDLSHGPRNSIRRATRDGVTVRASEDVHDLAIFYNMYLKQRRRQRLLPQPEGFVRMIYEKLIVPGDGFIVTAEHDGRPLCVILAIGHGSTVISTHSAADPLARQLLAMPLAMWKIIEVACARGYTRYDLGRSPTTADGLLNFKDQWGAPRRDLPYFFFGRASGVNTAEPSRLKKFLLNAYTRLAPEPIFAGLSTPMYRHLG